MDLIFKDKINEDEYIIAKYYIASTKTLKDAAWNLAIGQSVGNPNIRNDWETDDLFNSYSCKVLENQSLLSECNEGIVRIGFPICNTNWNEDGISHLLCQLMGGQLDIDVIKKCHLLELKIPTTVEKYFNKPKYGINGIRKYLNVYNKPLLGGIIKPKIGITPDVLLCMVKELVEGGINFIKEDEIMANPSICPINVRVPLISKYLRDREQLGFDKVIYAVCINADAPYALERAKLVHALGGNAIHINFWSGFGIYNAIRKLNLPLFIHFQKSGDKILTNKNHDFHIDWKVICQLAGLMGVDFIHAGMWGGYMNDNEDDLRCVQQLLHSYNVMPVYSCGMHPGLVNAITTRFGHDYMANCGGSIHGHIGGTQRGTKAMRQAIDGNTDGYEYKQAIMQFGLVD